MKRKQQTVAAAARPWWLEEESECGFCLQRHALHLEVRCSYCDRAVCRACAVIVRTSRETWCPECAAELEER